jgi:hypothetical protein
VSQIIVSIVAAKRTVGRRRSTEQEPTWDQLAVGQPNKLHGAPGVEVLQEVQAEDSVYAVCWTSIESGERIAEDSWKTELLRKCDLVRVGVHTGDGFVAHPSQCVEQVSCSARDIDHAACAVSREPWAQKSLVPERIAFVLLSQSIRRLSVFCAKSV